VTAPRIPCNTLATKMEDPTFVKKFRHAERPGLYCRVLQEGTVSAGDSVSWQRYERDTVSVLEMFRDFYIPNLNEATLRRYLDAPIAIRDRNDKEKRLRALIIEPPG
ncbi:MAG: MOSC domain-containing protein, partial [Chloroflexota bacterium]